MSETLKIRSQSFRSRPSGFFSLRTLSATAAAEAIALAFSAQGVAAKPKYCAVVLEGRNIGTGVNVRLLDGAKGELLVAENLTKEGQRMIVDAPSENGVVGTNLDISTTRGTFRLQEVACQADRDNPKSVIRIDFSSLPKIISDARASLTGTPTATRTATATATKTSTATATRTATVTSTPTKTPPPTSSPVPEATTVIPGSFGIRETPGASPTTNRNQLAGTATVYATKVIGELIQKDKAISSLTAQNKGLETTIGEYDKAVHEMGNLTGTQYAIITVENLALLALFLGRSVWQLVQRAGSRRGRTMHSEEVSQALDDVVNGTEITRQPRGRVRFHIGNPLNALRRVDLTKLLPKSRPQPNRGLSDLEQRAAAVAGEIAGDGQEDGGVSGASFVIDMEAAAAGEAARLVGLPLNSADEGADSVDGPASTRSPKGRSDDQGGF